MRALAAIAVLAGLLAAPVAAQPSLPVPAIAQPAVIGPLAIASSPAANGRTLSVVVSLQNVTVGAAALQAPYPTYLFDVTVGTTTAKGSLTAVFMPPGQLSSVTADLTVQIQGQTAQPFRGGVFYWQVPGTP